MKYTKSQRQLLNHAKKEVADLFKQFPVPGHDFDHSKRVAKNAYIIATAEHAKNVFLCELSGWLHDIGRAPEHYTKNNTQTHHELSYEMLRTWLKEDQAFDLLTKPEKMELLYAVRYHWNNLADKYDTAWILRDGDKLDVFGKIGLARARVFYAGSDEKLNMGMRYAFEIMYTFHTKTAKKIMKDKQLIKPILHFYKKYLKSKIEPVEL